MEQVCIAAMGNGPPTVDPLLVEPKRHRIERSNRGRVIIVHKAGRFWLKKLSAVGEMGDHKFTHVRAAGRQAAGRRGDYQLEGSGRLSQAPISAGHIGLKLFRKWLAEGRMVHSKRAEYMLIYIIIEG